MKALSIVLFMFMAGSALAQEYDDEGLPLDIMPDDPPVMAVQYARCSSISGICINYIFPNLIHCEAGKPQLYDCIAVNVTE